MASIPRSAVIDGIPRLIVASSNVFHAVSGSPALSNAEGVRNFGEGRFLGLADLNAAKAEQAATLARRFGGTLADLTKPAFEGCSIAGGLCRQHRRNLAQTFDRFGLDVC